MLISQCTGPVSEQTVLIHLYLDTEGCCRSDIAQQLSSIKLFGLWRFREIQHLKA